jgi:hypothetical protein
MKKIHCIPMLLIAALVLCSGISESLAQPPDPCATARANTNSGYFTGNGLFVCTSEIVPDDQPEGWEDWCDCHNDCYYLHIRNLINSCDTINGRIIRIRIALQNDSTSDDICIGGPFKQWGMTPWNNPWNVVNAGGSLPFPTDSCITWGIDMAKAVDTKSPAVDQDIVNIGNHWTAKVCGSRTITLTIEYDGTNPPANKTIIIGPLAINSAPCPSF